MRVIRILHARGHRWLAISDADHERYLEDPSIIDSLRAEACLRVLGRRQLWLKSARCADSMAGREAIRARLILRHQLFEAK